MARYRKVEVKVHDSEMFLSLSKAEPSGQYLWLYLLTSPLSCSVPGLLRAGPLTLAESIRWSPEDTIRCMEELTGPGHVIADWDKRIIWMPRAITRNMPESPSVIVGWRTHIDDLPRCPLKNRIIEDLEGALEGLGRGFQSAWSAASGQSVGQSVGQPAGQSVRHQEQEQEQEQEQDPTRERAAVKAEAAKRKPKPPEPVALDDRMQSIRDAMEDTRIPIDGWTYPSGTIADILGDRADEVASVLGGSAYPNVPPVSTLQAVRGWCVGNRDKAKKRAGLPRFLIGWWQREQERASTREQAAPAAAPAPSPDAPTVHRDPHVAAALRALARYEDRRHTAVDEETLHQINQILACDRSALPVEWEERCRGSARVERVDGFWLIRGADGPPPDDEIAAARERMRIAAEAQETDEEQQEGGK